MNVSTDKLTGKVMNQIKSGEVRMRPRWQFALVAVLTAVGLAAVAIVTVFLVNLVVYKLRIASADRPMYGAESATSYYGGHFPWLAFGIGVVSFGLLVWLVRRYDFSYRAGRWLLAVVIVASLGIGTALAFTSLNNHLETFGPMRGIYGQQMQKQKSQNHGMNQNGKESPQPNGSSNGAQHSRQK